jgi:hypothetical protein
MSCYLQAGARTGSERKKMKWELKTRSRNRKSKFKQHTGTNTGTDQKIIEIGQGQSSMKLTSKNQELEHSTQEARRTMNFNRGSS